MEERLVSYETALLAKEKLFNIPTLYFYFDSKLKYNHSIKPRNNNIIAGSLEVSAPTQSLLQKWLRDKHNLHIEIRFLRLNWIFFIYDLTNPNRECLLNICWLGDSDYFESKGLPTVIHTYEQALETALINALKLIK